MLKAVSCIQLPNFYSNYLSNKYFFFQAVAMCKLYLNKSYFINLHKVNSEFFHSLEGYLASCLVFARFQPGCLFF